MKIVKLRNGKFKAESHEKGKFYDVNLEQPFCTCPNFVFRMVKTHGECKHIKAVKEKYGKSYEEKSLKKFGMGKAEGGKKPNKIIAYVHDKGEVDSIELIEKFGEKSVNELLQKGDLIEEKGRVKVLE